ncbi:glycosyltransferase family 4 protein [Streptomyces zagrosensis]|uniref:D-inositol 3-phosphate glycosyltransferase n=1 Tax=Streptomyces zagrosensis TaxID=1042984 RepID=A0A7W9UX60_9ACTN|nr:glycosyltransferase family 4 protein [Streptomyces zagrosensis]MBB5933374.1 glycosyltransferase involved in cell wall biosynthesis [Streptomyces zagrosensis]
MKIVFLIHNAYGIGGTIRSTLNLSTALAAGHDVEVVSVHRVADEPQLSYDARVPLTSLIDMREDSPTYEGEHELTKLPNTMFPDKGVDFGRLRYTALHDERIAGFLGRTDADVVIATRPILNGYLARYGQRRCLRIGQEHLSLDAHSDQLRTDQNTALRDLDAFVTVSEADARQYRTALPGIGTTILAIPNGVPRPEVEPSSLDSRVIVSAGRLVAVKRYDRLINAFAAVAADYPDWTLRLYGRGPERPKLRRLIDELGLYDRVFLMGAVSPIETEWAKGAVAAVASDMESFGMTIVEAMHCGVPVIATDCPHGPAEIISHGQDGLLVPLAKDEPIPGAGVYADALRSLMSDETLRRKLGAGALAKASSFAPDVIGRRYEELFTTLSRERAPGRAGDRDRERAPKAERPGLLRRMRAALRGDDGAASASGAKSGTPGAAETTPRHLAFARSSAIGDVRIRLTADAPPAGPLDFVARLRRDPQRREVRVPLPETETGAGDGSVNVTLQHSEHTLPEGRWDCYVAPRGSNTRTRLTAALTEQARLIGQPPVRNADGIAAWVPYTTTDGFLALRTWQRPAHAEVTRIAITHDAATITARVLAPTGLPLTEATVHAAAREDAAHDFAVPVTPLGDDLFTFTLPYAEALQRRTVEHDLWDLTVRTADQPPVPLGRITGDLVDRKKTDYVPPALHEHPTRGTTRIKPFFTVTNNVALSARDEAAEGE